MSKLLFKLSDIFMKEEETIISDNSIYLLGEICMNRVAGIVYKNLKKIKKFGATSEFVNSLRVIYEDNIEKNKRFAENVTYIAKLFEEEKFQYALLKGAILTTTLYESGCRTSNDIDILINESDISKCQNVLLNNGFIQGTYEEGHGIIPATRREILMSRMNYGETIPFVKLVDSEPLEIDLNFSVDFKPQKDKDIVSMLIDETICISYNEVTLRTLNYEDFLIHLCCHLYKEATTLYWVEEKRDLTLYKFCDINLFLHSYSSPEFFERLIKRIKEFGVEKECYYTFYNSSIIYPNLNDIKGFNECLKIIEPNELDFMQQIINPENKRVYKYELNFLNWFDCADKHNYLRSI